MAGNEAGFVSILLKAYQDKLMVDRILHPENYPVLDNQDGSYSTHSMSYMTDGSGATMFPTVHYDPQTQQMFRADPRTSYVNALATGDAMTGLPPELAAWLSENYKSVWDK